MSIPTCSSTSGACSSIVSSSAMSLSRSCSSIFLSSETWRRLRGLPRNGAFAILFTGADRATLEPVLRTVACSDRSRGRRREGDFVRDFIVFGAMHDPPEPCRCTLAWVRHNAVHTYVCRAAVGSVSDDPPIGKPVRNLICHTGPVKLPARRSGLYGATRWKCGYRRVGAGCGAPRARGAAPRGGGKGGTRGGGRGA